MAENSSGKHIKYEKLLMQEYLTETDVKLSCDDRKWLFKCRTNDIDLKANSSRDMSSTLVFHAKKNIAETNEHILICEKLIRKKGLVT